MSQNISFELLNSLLMDAGLFIAVPLIALSQLTFQSMLSVWLCGDSDTISSREWSAQTAPRTETASDITGSLNDVELKRLPAAERQFKRRSPIVIER